MAERVHFLPAPDTPMDPQATVLWWCGFGLWSCFLSLFSWVSTNIWLHAYHSLSWAQVSGDVKPWKSRFYLSKVPVLWAWTWAWNRQIQPAPDSEDGVDSKCIRPQLQLSGTGGQQNEAWRNKRAPAHFIWVDSHHRPCLVISAQHGPFSLWVPASFWDFLVLSPFSCSTTLVGVPLPSVTFPGFNFVFSSIHILALEYHTHPSHI